MKIALAFSGGGYRAAAFNLGVLTYLDSFKIGGKSLLQQVCVLSTVSGGTITGARYAAGLKNGETLQEIYQSLYRFMMETDLVSNGLERLVSSRNWHGKRSRGLITSFADIYDATLFNGLTFGALMKEEPVIHLDHISFNATDFKNALQFRFQWTQSENEKSRSGRGKIGNNGYVIPESSAQFIRLGDIVATSSCFPGGFEPVNFPGDFVYPKDKIKDIHAGNSEKIGLMDGGIVDNQGIEAILLAEDRMSRTLGLGKNECGDHIRALDLIIVSDVASPFMKTYIANEQKEAKGWRVLTPQQILVLVNILMAGSAVMLFTFLSKLSPAIIILLSAVLTATLIIDLIVALIVARLKKVEIIQYFRHPLRLLLKLRLGVYETMIINRVKSVSKMVGEVFLKHSRKLHYDSLYKDRTWMNRLITNAIYQLEPERYKSGLKISVDDVEYTVEASELVQKIAEKAAGMSTSLWFTSKERKKSRNGKNMLEHIIACGQFTICWNLLDYFQKKDDKGDLLVENQSYNEIKKQLMDDLNRFNENPFWFTEDFLTNRGKI